MSPRFEATSRSSEATGQRKPTWLFFGHQHQRFDSLYEDDFERWAQGGVLSRADYAWSRDQDHKIYVQDRLREQGEAIWSWLERDAVVFVCGDAQGMAPGVAAAFAEIAQTHGGQADGAAYVASLTEQGRYKTDVLSTRATPKYGLAHHNNHRLVRG